MPGGLAVPRRTATWRKSARFPNRRAPFPPSLAVGWTPDPLAVGGTTIKSQLLGLIHAVHYARGAWGARSGCCGVIPRPSPLPTVPLIAVNSLVIIIELLVG